MKIRQTPSEHDKARCLGSLNNSSLYSNNTALVSVASFLVLVSCTLITVFIRHNLEFPIIRFFNQFAGRSAFFDSQFNALQPHAVSGAVFLSAIWYTWFSSTTTDHRARILVGTLSAALAGILSRVLQLTLPTHPRPLHTPELAFHLPIGVDPTTLNHWNSFPSDHGATYFGLAMVIYLGNPKLGRVAFAWAIVLDFARLYLGFHSLIDIIGGAALGTLVVSLLQNQKFLLLGSRLLSFEKCSAPAFYMVAFLVTYQIATLFTELRNIGAMELNLFRAVLHR